MVFWLCTKIFEDRLLPVPLHIVPVIDLTVADRVVYAIARCLSIGKSLISDKEVKVFDAALGCEMSWLGGYSGAGATRLSGRSTCGDGSWKHTTRELDISSYKGQESNSQ